MPIPPWGSAPGSGGGSSPLTTKGDIFVHGSSDARLPVGTDGQIVLADSSQTLGLGYSTRQFDFNNQIAGNIQSLMIGETSSGNLIGGFEIGTTLTSPSAAKVYTFNLIDAITFGASKPFITGGAPFAMNSAWTINSASGLCSFDHMFINSLINGSANLLVVNGIFLQPETDNYSGTISGFVGIDCVPKFLVNTTTVTDFKGIRIGSPGPAATFGTVTGFDLGDSVALPSGGTATWGMRVGNYNNWIKGPTAFGNKTNGTPAPTYPIELETQGSFNLMAGMLCYYTGTSITTPSSTATGGTSHAQVISSVMTDGTHQYIAWAYNDNGTVRYTTIGPLDGTGAASIAKGTSIP